MGIHPGENKCADNTELGHHKNCEEIKAEAEMCWSEKSFKFLESKIYLAVIPPSLTDLSVQYSAKENKAATLAEMRGASKERIMLELSETCRLAVRADLTNLFLLQSQGEVSLYSPQGEDRQLLTGEEGDSVERCVRTRRHVMATCKVSVGTIL